MDVVHVADQALEDLSMQYDRTVRNSESTVVQFTYGNDGLDPACMEGDDRPVVLERVMTNIKAMTSEDPSLMLDHYDIRYVARTELESDAFQKLRPAGELFISEVDQFIEAKAKEIERLLDAFGCPSKAGAAPGDWSRAQRAVYPIAGVTEAQLRGT